MSVLFIYAIVLFCNYISRYRNWCRAWLEEFKGLIDAFFRHLLGVLRKRTIVLGKNGEGTRCSLHKWIPKQQREMLPFFALLLKRTMHAILHARHSHYHRKLLKKGDNIVIRAWFMGKGRLETLRGSFHTRKSSELSGMRNRAESPRETVPYTRAKPMFTRENQWKRRRLHACFSSQDSYTMEEILSEYWDPIATAVILTVSYTSANLCGVFFMANLVNCQRTLENVTLPVARSS